ncbi:MAG: hypothetical protein ABW026_17235 [Microvirga sp.]
MANSPTPSSPSTPDRSAQPEAHLPDHKLPENSRENLDNKLDSAIEETFPTSDPISVKITKGGAIDYDRQDREQAAEDERQRRGGEGLLRQARDQVRNVAQRTSEAARAQYDQGRHYAQDVSERFPQVERTYREGSRAVGQAVSGNPLLSLMLAGTIGYALAWLIHGNRHEGDHRVPDYARTRYAYRASRRT